MEFNKKDLLENYEFAANQIARFFIKRYWTGAEWYWQGNFIGSNVVIEGVVRYTIEEILGFLKNSATKKQMLDYSGYRNFEEKPLSFKHWKSNLKRHK